MGVGGGRENGIPLLSETAFQRQGLPRSGVLAPVCSSSLGRPWLPCVSQAEKMVRPIQQEFHIILTNTEKVS